MVVWIPWIPLWMGFLLRAEQGPSSFISHKIHGTGILTCMNGWCLSVFMSIYHIYIDPVGIAPQNVYRTLPFSGHVWKKMRGKTRNLIARCASQLKRMRADSTDRGRLDGRSDFQRWCSGRGISHTCRADSDLDGHANLMAQWKYCRWRGRRAATGPGQAPDRRSHAGGARAVAHEDSQRERGDRRYAAPDRTRVLREG